MKPTIDMFQMEGDPFILGVKNPKNKDKYVAWTINEYLMDGSNTVKVWFIYTLPKHRRKGYASELLKMLQDVHSKLETNYEFITDEGAQVFLANGFKNIRSINNKGANRLIWTNTSENKTQLKEKKE